MPGYDFVGNAQRQTQYTGINPYTNQLQTQNIPGRTAAATSTGPYDQSSPLGSAYQAQPFNLGQSGNLTQLSDLINSINRNAQTQNLQARIPNAPALEAQSSANIGSELQGQLPQDVMNLLGQQAAERGVGTGIGADSQNASAAYLRALGQTSLQQEQLGQQNLTSAYARNPAAPLFDTGSQVISPLNLAQIQEQGLGLNAQIQSQLANQNLAQQRINQGYGYSYPQYSYGSPTTGNSITGQDLLPADTTTASTGGGIDYIQAPWTSSLSNAYDFPDDYANPVYGGGDYARTPVSMYG